ncbi:leucine-rich repeat protein lrrA-like [Dreissena polymorpha]|uniref:Disease resistance R13L4/SHOC-2-like LRR domain-containing protein n=1 Tax=Dreissena polymorpha TaxID=45954 RepID=A0A9D4M1Z8_DREPO|nr:leucine-rich repeat protein lrrA-like [Dreissena polymorpha]XP_052264543.1 leucine-rich repeat protein lrrA-like [Dreissena polymorpha]KAH3866966.1 hypothetical protein DPMN_030090 [Dreissena polymorpha]
MENATEEDLTSSDLKRIPESVIENKHVVKLLLDFNEIEFLPEEFGLLTSLKTFSASGNNFTALPDSIGDLVNLEDLDLNENRLSKLPDSFCKLDKLKSLKLKSNILETLPDNFGELISLQLFHCDENALRKLPKTFGLLENLFELDLCSNVIESLLEGFGMLKSLQVLNLSNNKISNIPESFGNLPNLVSLDLSSNNVKNLPSNFKSSHCIQKIYIESNVLQTLPDWFSELDSLVEISIQDNQLQGQALSDKFPCHSQNLKHLDISGNFMSKLPSELGAMKKIEFIHLGSVIGELERRNFQNGNWLAEIPDSICELVNLRELHLDENQINDLPAEFGKLVSLEILDLGQNLLHVLPESFGRLSSLRICMLSKNHLMWLPSNFGDLSALEDLRLDDNEIAELPKSFCKLTKLKTLDLFSNRLTEVPSALQHLKNLVRLDIESNDFSLPLTEIPMIITKTRYPERDPSLKDNWRGRARQDLPYLQNVIKVSTENVSIPDFEAPPSDLPFNEDFLARAAMRSMSIWRSHADTTQDRRPFRRKTRPPSFNAAFSYEEDDDDKGSSGDADSVDNEEGVGSCDSRGSGSDYDNIHNPDDEFEPPVYVEAKKWSGYKPPEPPFTGTHVSVKMQLEETENWEEEIEQNIQQHGTYNSPVVYIDPLKIYYPPIDNGLFTFVPVDLHERDYIKRPENYAVEENQFENCDSDETEDVRVDPVF